MNSNSNPRKPNTSQTGSASFNNYQFDFGIAPNRPSSARSLNDKKHQQQNPPYSFSPSPSLNPTSSSSSWASNKPSWTHQPSPSPAPRSGLLNPNSMVGDIFGKSWASTTTSTAGTRIGIADSNPNLFGDLVGKTLGQGRSSSSNVPLKNMAAAPQKNLYSMGNLADSLPKTVNPMKNSSWESAENLGNFSAVNSSSSGSNRSGSFSAMKSGPSMNSKNDPFGSLGDFGSKHPPTGNSSSNKNNSSNDFGDFQTPNASNSASIPKMDDFGIPSQDFTSQMSPPPPPQSKGVDPLDMLFSSSSAAASAIAAASVNGGSGMQPFSDVDDWGLDSDFGGNDTGGGTIELEGLPPPPAGVTASMAKGKGLDNYKQGQFADAIKWLSWAVALLEKAGDDAVTVEILSCRASCYKEVGEYKKAVADCSKILEQDSENVSVLLQRALLYESSEKYKLGAEDLRAVLKIDPGNRLAKSTIHRLTKLSD